MHFSEIITLNDALLISLISITTVFAILILISLIISLIGKMLKEEKKPAAPVASATQTQQVVQQPTAKVDLSSVVKDEHKRVALLVATMEANTNDEDKKYQITSIREV